MKSRICGTGSMLPNRVVTNDDLSKIMDTSDEWIRSRTGICSRHLAVEESLTELAAQASRKALEEAGVKPEELDMILAATLSADKLLPCLSCELQRELGAVNAVAFDINAACSGFMFALQTADMYIKSGQCQRILVVGGEILSKLMDWNDRSTCVLFGDGAGAAVVRADEEYGILSSVQGSDGAKGDALLCEGRRNNNPYVSNSTDLPYVSMNGQEVYKFAVRTVPKAILEALQKADLTVEDVDLFVLHQANIRIIESVSKRLKVPMEKFPSNLEECGNISAGSVPILLDYVNQRGMLHKGDKIVLAGFGAGLTWGASVLTW
ncbi:MAG: ketoacyl-ACP synthase III [Lachnospiraceae bacterium]|nr:ketoacyl-ACP synthase III [Lachnospiraceae bacterium]